MGHSLKTRMKISNAAKKQWSDPVTRQNALDGFKRRSENPVWRAHCHQPKTPEHAKKIAIRMRILASTPAWRAKISALAKERFSDKTKHPSYGKPRSEESNEKQSIAMTGRKLKPFTEDHKNKIGKAHSGPKCTFWKGGVSSFPYCPLFNESLKKRVRSHFGNKCVICGKTKSENVNRNLSVHHVYVEKMTCCEHNIRDMDLVRNRLPTNVAMYGSPTFTVEEKRHIRMMVPLCGHCHQKVGFVEADDTPYENSIYRKYFTDLINSQYDGICFKEVA